MAKRAVVWVTLCAGIAFTSPAAGKQAPGEPLALTPQISTRLAWAKRCLDPSGFRKLAQQGRLLAPAIAAGFGFPALRERAGRQVAAAFGSLSGMDVSEAAFIVLSQATKDMDDDIRMIMAEIKAMTAAKQDLRDSIAELNNWISAAMNEPPGSGIIGSEPVPGRKPGAGSTLSPDSRPATRNPAPPARRLAFEPTISPVIQFEYVKAPVIPRLAPQSPGLPASSLKSLLDERKADLELMDRKSGQTSKRLQTVLEHRARIVEALSVVPASPSCTESTLVRKIR